MKKVLGLGGVFIRARDPQALGEWYKTTLGIEMPVWTQEAGPTVVAPFDYDTDYFGLHDQQFMLNFRVGNLERMIDELQAKGIEVITKDEWNSDVGTFARIHDPEGNPIELWQPAEGLEAP